MVFFRHGAHLHQAQAVFAGAWFFCQQAAGFVNVRRAIAAVHAGDGQVALVVFDVAVDLPPARRGHARGGLHGVVEHVYEQRAEVALVDVQPGGHQGAAAEFHALFRGARGGVLQYGVDGPVLGVLLGVKAVEHAGELVEPRLQSRAVPALRQEPEGG